MLFKHPEMLRLFSEVLIHQVVFDQCQYGLTIAGAEPDELCKKPTMLYTSLEYLLLLGAWCLKPCSHRHVTLLGRTKLANGTSVTRSALAGIYPHDLCTAWPNLVAVGLDSSPPPQRRAWLRAGELVVPRPFT